MQDPVPFLEKVEIGRDFTPEPLRVIVHTHKECYHALGILSSLWPPMPGMFSDYIAQSKGNMYQSLHIKVLGPQLPPPTPAALKIVR